MGLAPQDDGKDEAATCKRSSVTYLSILLLRVCSQRKNVDGNAEEIARFAFISSGSAEDKGAMAAALGPVKISHKKMAAKGGSIDFAFFAPLPPTRPLDLLFIVSDSLAALLNCRKFHSDVCKL